MRIAGYKLKALKHQQPITLRSLLATNPGFTLLELIVVIFIISIILAVSLPSFSGMGASRLKSDSKRVASMLRYSNDTAITTKCSIEMKVNLSEKTIYYNGPDGEKKEKIEDLIGISLQSKGLISEGEVIVFFYPSGAAENINIHLKDRKSSTIIALNSSSGRVKISDEKED